MCGKYSHPLIHKFYTCNTPKKYHTCNTGIHPSTHRFYTCNTPKNTTHVIQVSIPQHTGSIHAIHLKTPDMFYRCSYLN